MTHCCAPSGQTAHPKKNICPANGLAYAQVSAQTLLHHVKNPWLWQEKPQGYYFCDDPLCDVVYFGEDGAVFTTSDVRTVVSAKNSAPEALICYCFGISRAAALSNPAMKAFVVQKTKDGLCSCTTHNPSGRCCLKDFARFDKTATPLSF